MIEWTGAIAAILIIFLLLISLGWSISRNRLANANNEELIESIQELEQIRAALEITRQNLEKRETELRDQRRAALNIAADAKAAQCAAEEAEIRAVLAVEAAPNAMIMVDDSGRIVLVNAETERLFGYDRGEVLGQPIEIFVPHRFRKQHGALRADFIKHLEARPMSRKPDLYAMRRDGSEFPVEIGLNPLEISKGRFVLSAIVDLTERRRTAGELHHRREEIEQLLYTVSHDLKSPLVTIGGFASMVEEALNRNDIEEAKDSASRVVRGTKTMGSLINDLLALSRVGRQSMTPKTVDVGQLIADVRETLDIQFADADARLEFETPIPTIRVPPTRLKKIFMNLIANAVKYGCPEPGQAIRVGYVDTPLFHQFYVRDDGPGIPPEYHKQVFIIFRRIKSQKDGSGLGLAIVRKAAQALGGDAWVESEPGAGATFWFTVAKNHVQADKHEEGTS